MALHVVQAQDGSSVIVVAAFVVLLPAAAQLVLDHLLKREFALWDSHFFFMSAMSHTFCYELSEKKKDTCFFENLHKLGIHSLGKCNMVSFGMTYRYIIMTNSGHSQ